LLFGHVALGFRTQHGSAGLRQPSPPASTLSICRDWSTWRKPGSHLHCLEFGASSAATRHDSAPWDVPCGPCRTRYSPLAEKSIPRFTTQDARDAETRRQERSLPRKTRTTRKQKATGALGSRPKTVDLHFYPCSIILLRLGSSLRPPRPLWWNPPCPSWTRRGRAEAGEPCGPGAGWDWRKSSMGGGTATCGGGHPGVSTGGVEKRA